MIINSNTAAFLKKNKTIIIIALLFIIVSIYFYRKGKKTTTIAPLPTDTPKNTNNPGGVNLTGNVLSNNDVASFREQLHKDIHDIFALRNNALYADLVLLSDTDLVRIYNAYNEKYQEKDSETLLEALNNELTAWFGAAGRVNMQIVIDRLTKFNLK